MKVVRASQTEKPAVSPMEWLLERWAHVRIPPRLTILLVVAVLTVIASTVSVRLSEQYYRLAPYHYDSAGYRLQAVAAYHHLQTQGLVAAFGQALTSKDSLDIALRVLIAPSTLLDRFGHMVVLIPFMGFFLSLTLWYVYVRTSSLAFGAVTVAFLFTASMFYDPVAGIADYWKDSIGAWLLGSACIGWLLSDQLRYRRWAAVAGTCLGLLLLQRTSASVYMGMLLAPLFLLAFYQRWRAAGWRIALINASFLVVPVAFCAIPIALQFKNLFTYYSVIGYAYTSISASFDLFIRGLPSFGGFLPFFIPIAYLFCLISITNWRVQIREIAIALWLVLGFPMAFVSAGTVYLPGAYPCWSVLLTLLLATLIPRFLSGTPRFILVGLLLFMVVTASILQYGRSNEHATQPPLQMQLTRQFYQQLAQLILSQPEPQVYKLVFNEVGAIFANQLIFDNVDLRGAAAQESPTFISIHDSYYRAAFGDMPADQIVRKNIETLEQTPGTLAIADCNPENIATRPGFAPDPSLEYRVQGSPFAITVVTRMSDHFLSSPHWKAIRRFDSPFGCLYAYVYSPQPVSPAEKWRQLTFHESLNRIPLALGVGPDVRMYDYQSRYDAEYLNGVYYQWLPSGANGMGVDLFADQPQTIVLEARAIPGPARRDAARTIVVSNGAAETMVQVAGEQDIQIPVSLQAGLNQIRIAVRDMPDGTAANSADPRELMLLFVSPRFVRLQR